MINYGERAAALFSQGYNCAQSVFGAFAEDYGIGQDVAVKMASSFGGGIAGTRGVCGAVSGMLFAAGLIKGYSDPSARDLKQEHYSLCRALMEEFEAACGSVICRELLAVQQSGEKKMKCGEMCRLAAEILAKHI